MHYLYVDGENHYMRNLSAMQDKFGKDVDLARIKARHGVDINRDCCFFWDAAYYSIGEVRPFRKVYFSAYTGGHEQIDTLSEYIRGKGFEPQLIKEEKDHLKRRKDKLEELKLIDKPKGVDIMLAVRMIEDAAAGNYQSCRLFTSDADFLPLIKAVRRLGKHVTVYGFRENVGNRELLYVPDEFVDLGNYYKGDHYHLPPAP